MISINNEWNSIINKAADEPSFLNLRKFLIKEYKTETVYPPMNQIWTAFEWTPYEEVKVVILGQDPYHGFNQAHGLSFSVQPGIKTPPSLQNIYKELEADLGYLPVSHGYLKHWAQQGVLLLNTVLTVRQGEPNSHRKMGWEELTDAAIKSLNDLNHPVVFILWGRQAQQKKELIDLDRHYIIESSHPSPFSARYSFFGSRPFSRTNQLLRESGQKEIDWQLPPHVEMTDEIL